MAKKAQEFQERALTLRETMLQAMGQIDELRGGGGFTQEDVTVVAWRLNPQLFGLRGYEGEHPNAAQVNAKVSDFVRLGVLVRDDREGGGSMLRLTRVGRSQARPLVARLRRDVGRAERLFPRAEPAPAPPAPPAVPETPAPTTEVPVVPRVRAAEPGHADAGTVHRVYFRRRKPVDTAEAPRAAATAQPKTPAPSAPSAPSADPAQRPRPVVRQEPPPFVQLAAPWPQRRRAVERVDRDE